MAFGTEIIAPQLVSIKFLTNEIIIINRKRGKTKKANQLLS